MNGGLAHLWTIPRLAANPIERWTYDLPGRLSLVYLAVLEKTLIATVAWTSLGQVESGTVRRTRVQVTPGRGDRGVSQSGLNEMEGRLMV